jgi:hypothetical protein
MLIKKMEWKKKEKIMHKYFFITSFINSAFEGGKNLSENRIRNEWFYMKYVGKHLSAERLLTLECTTQLKLVKHKYKFLRS